MVIVFVAHQRLQPVVIEMIMFRLIRQQKQDEYEETDFYNKVSISSSSGIS